MNDLTPTREERIANLKGMGTSRKRVEPSQVKAKTKQIK